MAFIITLGVAPTKRSNTISQVLYIQVSPKTDLQI